MTARALNLTLALGLVLGVAVLAGCSAKEGNEFERLVCEVESVNLGVPLISAYLNVGSDGISGTNDDYLPIDWVPVAFVARPYSSTIVLPEDGPHSWFHVTGYDLTWHPGPGAPEDMSDYDITDGYCDAIVPVGEDAMVSVLIADRFMKEQTWFQDLYTNIDNAQASCELIFKGHESGSDRMVSIPAGLQVSFIGSVKDD